MKKLAVLLFLICASTSLSIFDGQAWGSADTLLPRTDGEVGWTVSGCAAGEHYDCVDDPPGSPDGDDTRVYTNLSTKIEAFYLDSTFVESIDSVVIKVNAQTSGTALYLQVGFEFFLESWQWWTEDSALLTTEWTDYSVKSGQSPWTASDINKYRWGVRTPASMPIFTDAEKTQVFLIVYYTEEEADNYSGKCPRGIARGIMR